MALQNHSENKKRMSDDCLSSTMSSSALEIILDDQSFSNSADEEFMDQIRQSKVGTTGSTGSESSAFRRKKLLPLRDPKSHRLIEKRRRDRMNACLNELLQLTPHKNNESQRRIEKTEIIEMAITHILLFLFLLAKKTDTYLDSYRTGYQNGLSDVFEFINEYAESDQINEFAQYCKEKEIDLKSLTVLPDRKRTKYLSLSDKQNKLPISSKEQITKPNLLNKNDDKLCTISDTEQHKHSDLEPSIRVRQTSTEQYDSPVKVPIFVLHPSGTHYIPMCIDASIVSHAFTKNSNKIHSSTKDQAQCHPVSIPVNFNPGTAFSDPYELDIQNINVIGTRHQTSVRPN
ncbi:unnamed protein product [Rotaria sp. Silwood2]|nr:unnamed protein product [Rotaria sp. Silwood2]CAF2657783.1 unnamed protein product [Rotaria sp. Silwood2]CAF3065958.1 unnamed protein product [Rotaria sp. Silwood2]CAF3865632.1 unnamed protein product [Rotaria sp. Silwood2]